MIRYINPFVLEYSKYRQVLNAGNLFRFSGLLHFRIVNAMVNTKIAYLLQGHI